MNFTFHTDTQLSGEDFESRLAHFQKLIESPEIGFFKLTDQKQHLHAVKTMGASIQDMKNFVQVGIGGSALGPEMLVQSLRRNDKKFLCLDNTDSDFIHRSLAGIDLAETVFYVVSKSGGTAETIACYSILKNLGATHFIFCTDPSQGQLREHVEKFNLPVLSLPRNVGGRFSVLSPVGLLPAHFVGADIDALYFGANEIKPDLLNTDFSKNSLFQAAEIIYKSYRAGINQTVMMPYSSLMRSFSHWFVQLWAESLGKENKGLTPIPAYGATDQHSQVQLFMEGPNDKLMIMISVENRNHDFTLESSLEFESATQLAPFSLNQLLKAEFQGSLQALRENGRHVIEINLKSLEEKSMGAMILFFESLTALMGGYLKIDPFNQPGVEKGKKYAFEFLNRL